VPVSPHRHRLQLLVASLAALAIQFLLVAAAAACTGGGTWPSY
jgi:hypothetical protein